ncbi:MAG TPA: hypothetical protein PKK06_02700 [Phycisphaerae bacterium]|nr:hypothetical protein [Phycisphaerae bacterium]HNU44595.1 hypothetical protein [Phycisphaerae bacterium]
MATTGMQKRHGGRVLLGIAIGVGVWATVAAAAETPEEMLGKLQERFERVRTLHQVTVTTAKSRSGSHEVTDTLWLKRDGESWKMRMERSSKAAQKERGAGRGDNIQMVTVIDGRFTWTETTVEGNLIAVKTPTEPFDPYTEIRQEIKQGTAKVKPDETLDDEPCVVFEVEKPAGKEKTQITFWLDKEHGVLLKILRVEPNDQRTETVTRELSVNERLGDDKFTYTPPEGAQVFEMGTAEEPKKP